jgi:hypothetical protein
MRNLVGQRNLVGRLLLLLVSLVALSGSAIAQKENNLWYFGDNAALDFNGTSGIWCGLFCIRALSTRRNIFVADS